MRRKRQSRPWATLLPDGAITRAALASLPIVSQSGLVLLAAPAGYGKTHIAAQWADIAAAKAWTVCWMALGVSGSTTTAFSAKLNELLISSGIPADKTTPLDNDRHWGAARLAETVSVRVTAYRRRVLLVFDSFDTVVGGEIDEFLRKLFDQVPSNLLIVLTSRRNLSMPVARLIMQGRYHRVPNAKMLFSKSESREYFNRLLSPQQLSQLHELSAGWPAVLQLARVCLPDWDKSKNDVRQVTEFVRQMSAYCEHEVLKYANPQSQQMLMASSVAQDLNPAICDAICGTDDSSRWIAELIMRDTVLEPVDPVRNIWRLPRLLRQYLCQKAADLTTDFVTKANMRAAQYFESQGELRNAIHHFISANNFTAAAEAFERAAPFYILTSQGDGYVATLLEMFPMEILRIYPRLLLCKICLHYKRGLVDEALYLLAELREQTNAFTKDREGGNDSLLKCEWLFAEFPIRFYGLSRAPMEYAREIESNLVMVSKCEARLLSQFYMMLGLLYYMRGDLSTSQTNFIECEKLSSRHPAPWISLWLKRHFGFLFAARGHLHDAKHSLKAGLALWENGFKHYEPYKAAVLVGLAEIDYEFNALSNAQVKLDGSSFQVEHIEGWFDTHSVMYEIAMMLHWHAGRINELEAMLIRVIAIPRVGPTLASFLEVLRLRFELFKGNLAGAKAIIDGNTLLERWRFTHFKELFSFREWDLIGLCLALYTIQSRAYASAKLILERLDEMATIAGRTRTSAKALALLSVIALHENDRPRALELMTRALELGQLFGYRRVFLDEGELIIPSLETLMGPQDDQLSPLLVLYAKSLRKDFRKKQKANLLDQLQQLSEREVEVLRDLSKGYSNKLIARRLDLSAATVNFHVRNLFRKLDVHKRASAVAEAHRRGWLAVDT